MIFSVITMLSIALLSFLGSNAELNLRYTQSITTPKTWKKVEMPSFSFAAPPDLSWQSSTNIDSAVWRFTSDTLILNIDMGLYSNKPNEDKDEPDYAERRVTISGKKATIVSFRDREPNSTGFQYVVAIYFPRIASDSDIKLSLVAYCKTLDQTETAMIIFQSIKFRGGSPATTHVLKLQPNFSVSAQSSSAGGVLIDEGFKDGGKLLLLAARELRGSFE